jgi:L-serine dehydratase
MGPKKACEIVKEEYNADRYMVKLYGSLSMTGKGHLTDKVIRRTLDNVDVIFSLETIPEHPNTMDLFMYKDDKPIGYERFYSIGGGEVRRQGEDPKEIVQVYPHKYFKEIREYCEEHNMELYDYVYKYEDKDFKKYLSNVWRVMAQSVDEGLNASGVLPGVLHVERKAEKIFNRINFSSSKHINKAQLASAYAYAVSETNASGGEIVTAPTCGASGVLPGVLYYAQEKYNYHKEKFINALAVAGLIGNIVKHNGSISGAEAGCQAEVGTACSMAAAAVSVLMDNDIETIETAAEMAMEHHLGLTCDPILGYVQIPCIERNGIAALRAINAAELAELVGENRIVSFDMVVETMFQTGKDLKESYRETAEAGLSAFYKNIQLQKRHIKKTEEENDNSN